MFIQRVFMALPEVCERLFRNRQNLEDLKGLGVYNMECHSKSFLIGKVQYAKIVDDKVIFYCEIKDKLTYELNKNIPLSIGCP